MLFNCFIFFLLLCFFSPFIFLCDTKATFSENLIEFNFKKKELKKELNLPLDRISIVGINAFPLSQFESMLELSSGDFLDRIKVLKTEENIQSFYKAHGYEKVYVKSHLFKKNKENQKKQEIILEFEVLEGPPTVIESASLVFEEASSLGEGNKDILFLRSKNPLKRIKKKAYSIVRIKKGEIFSQDRIIDLKRALQELFISENFIGSKVEAIKTESHLQIGKQHWVYLRFRIDLGEQVRFGFRGNSYYTKSNLDELIYELKVTGVSKDYIRVIRSKIEEEYRSSGFHKVAVSSYSIQGSILDVKKVIFVIQEGPRAKIDSIEFDGNDIYSSDFLRSELLSKASLLIQNGIYIEKDFKKAAELLIEKLKENGYLFSKLISVQASSNIKRFMQEKSDFIKTLIYLYEGPQTRVGRFDVSGGAVFSQEQLKKILHIEEGEPLNLYLLSEGIENLKHEYRNEGYLDFKILNEGLVDGSESLVSYRQENQVANIHLNLQEGTLYRVSHIEIDGLEKTKKEVVLRGLAFHEGAVLGESQIVESEKNLRKLGIFSKVLIRALEDPSGPGLKEVRVLVHESERGILTWGPGVRNDLGLRIFGQIAYTNLWGENHTALMTLNANRRFYRYFFSEYQSQFAYIWPWFGGVRALEFRPVIAVSRTQYINFAADTVAASTTWEKPFINTPSLVGSFTYSVERVHQFNSLDVTNNGELLIGSVSPKLKLDLRDHPLTPKSGLYAIAWVDFSEPFLGSNEAIAFYRLQWRADYHWVLFKELFWYFSIRTGYEKNLLKTPGADIPLIKQFALGGIGSLRGYQEQELNQQAVSVTGSLSYVNYRVQMDFSLAGSLRFGPFLDAANLLIDRYSFGMLLYGAGAGFHYITPVGPINLDMGFKLNPPPQASPYVIHFSIGIT